MRKRREVLEVLYDIKCEIPGFDKNELIEYVTLVIPNLYYEFKNKSVIKTKCTEKLIEKINANLRKYRATDNVDRISIQYVDLFDCIKKDDNVYIQVYMSIYFFDNVKNNSGTIDKKNKYWNDIWIITLKGNDKTKNIKESNCNNCGATMQYNQFNNTFKCNYCGNTIYNYVIKDWEIVDIEVEN